MEALSRTAGTSAAVQARRRASPAVMAMPVSSRAVPSPVSSASSCEGDDHLATVACELAGGQVLDQLAQGGALELVEVGAPVTTGGGEVDDG